MADNVDRREFLRTTALTGLGLSVGAAALSSCAHVGVRGVGLPGQFQAPPLETVRIGMVGIGMQGRGHLRNFLEIPGAEIRAVCDLLPDRTERAIQAVVDAGRPPPVQYSGGPEEYLRLCEQEDLDLVFNATPWEFHAPVCVAAMGNGKHVATEIPMAIYIDECWQLVELSETTGRHCVMMENCCYDRIELMILNMVRKGLLGELLHAECGYLHDLRGYKLGELYHPADWRLQHTIRRNADLYPMHGLGPVAQWLNVNRGNQFDFLVSMSCSPRGLAEYAEEQFGPGSPQATQRYAQGDVVNTLIRTKAGQSILVTHDTNLPRPYSRKILLQGTQGLVRKYPEQKIHIEGRSPGHRWEELAEYREEFEHPLWTEMQELARGAGHGGMDYIEDYRLIQCLREGRAQDMDVYDGAAWSAVIELSERSISARSQSVDCPDFTRGGWRTAPPLAVVSVLG
jgi:predicted dehydrogenase